MRDMRGILNNLSSMPTLTWSPQPLTKEDKCSDVVIALSLQQAPPPTHARQFWTGTHWNNWKMRIVEFRGWRSCSSLSCPRISPSSAYGLSPFPTIQAFLSSNSILFFSRWFLSVMMICTGCPQLILVTTVLFSSWCPFSIENAKFWLILTDLSYFIANLCTFGVLLQA